MVQTEALKDFLDQLAGYGIFAVPVGEVEEWLSHLAAASAKGKWLASIFEKMGSDPSSSGYVHPANGDVWDFIQKVNAWILDPMRKGMPG